MQDKRNRRGSSDNKNSDNTQIHSSKIKPKQKGAGALKIFLIIIAVLLLIIAACAVAIEVYRPDVDDGPAFDTGDINLPSVTDDNGEEVDGPSVSAGEYKRKDGVYNFLFVGKDRVAENTDVMMIISFDTKNDDV